MKERTKRIPVLAALVFFGVFTVFFYGPLSMFLENTGEFWFRISDTLLVTIIGSLIAFAILFALGFLLPEKAYSIYVKLLFGIFLGMYLQGTFINISYGNGVLDGTEIKWSDYKGYAVIDTLVWAVCIALPFVVCIFLKDKWKKAILFASVFLTVIQLPALTIDVINYKPAEKAYLTVTTEGMYDLGKEENVLIIALDTMDEDYFMEYLDNHPEYAENLDGFVHYTNMMSSGARTIIAVPSLLTGKPFTRDTTYSQYVDTIWSQENPLSSLNKSGWDVRCFSESDFYGSGAADYVENIDNGAEKVGSYGILGAKLFKLSAFRFAPHLLKRFFWLSTSEFDEAKAFAGAASDKTAYTPDDALFHTNFLSNNGYTVNTSYSKAFRFYLLKGAHSAYTLTSDGLHNKKKTSREEQVEGSFAVVKSLLDDLKAKGMYDSSLIILTADHGDQHIGEYMMFLYKAPGAKGAMTQTDVPASMFDLSGILYGIAGKSGKTGVYGEDIFSLTEDQIRERHFFYNTTNRSKVAIKEYVSSSHASDPDSLELVGTYIDTEGKDTPYKLGTTLTFDMDATANKYCTDGFGNTSGWLTRLYGPHAQIEIPIENLPKKGTLQVDIGVGKLYNSTSFIAYANNIPVFENDSANSKNIQENGIHFTLDIPTVFKDTNVLVLSFEFDEIDPDEMTKSVGKRTRTISFTSIEISKN